jgi:hypothetical protein
LGGPLKVLGTSILNMTTIKVIAIEKKSFGDSSTKLPSKLSQT